MEKAGVPFVPGTSCGVESVDQAREVAAQLGYPVMLKAAAGGGGKGMRLVESAREMPASLEAAQSEAERAFGSNEVYLEKAITNPRHIEIQVLADEHGHCVHLGERVVIAGYDVELAILIDVAHRNRLRIHQADGNGFRVLERAIAIAEQQQDRAGITSRHTVIRNQ